MKRGFDHKETTHGNFLALWNVLYSNCGDGYMSLELYTHIRKKINI